MIIPWKVDVPQERLPVANWLLIAVIIGFFVWQINQVRQYHQSLEDELSRVTAQKGNNSGIKIDPFKGLVLQGWTVRGLFGHMWLHSGWLHLIGNLLFLWIFGNAVCAKIGNIIYVPVYIILGLSAAVTYLFFSTDAALGASGAINGIVGMYLVFFPTNSITFFWSLSLIYWWRSEADSFWLILLWFVYDILGAALGGGHIAYYAHVGGFVTGFAIAIILLKTRLITMAPYEKSLLRIFSEMRSKPQPKKSYSDMVLRGEYLNSDEKSAAGVETKQMPQSVLSEDDFLRQSTPQVESFLQTQSEATKNDGFIRFYCTCGKRIKVSVQYAGKTGKCPQCKQPLQIPRLKL